MYFLPLWLFFSLLEGVKVQDLQACLGSMCSEQQDCAALLSALRERILRSERIQRFSSELQVLNQELTEPEEWLRSTGSSDSDKHDLKMLKVACEVSPNPLSISVCAYVACVRGMGVSNVFEVLKHDCIAIICLCVCVCVCVCVS